MNGLRPALLALAALLGALVPLLALDGDDRAWGFRAYVIVVGLVASDVLLRGVDRAARAVPAAMTANRDAGQATVGASPMVGDLQQASLFARPRRLPASVDARLRGAVRSVVRSHRHTPRLHGSATLVHAATSTAGAVHHRLRPVLRTIADERLRARHGTSLDEPSGRPRSVVAPPTWDLLRTDRSPPGDRLGPGLSLDELEAIVTDLERT